MAKEPGIIDQLVRLHLAPHLSGAGFARSGRTFRRFAGNGDAVVVGLQTSTGSWPARARFYLNVALVPVPWLVWLRQSDDLRNPQHAEGAVADRVRSSADVLALNDSWWCRTDEIPTCGPALVAALDALLPAYLALLDRSVLLDVLRNGSPLPGSCPRIALRALLAADAGAFDEARHDLDDIAAHDPASAFVTWLRPRLQ